jgi:hypothetical protein
MFVPNTLPGAYLYGEHLGTWAPVLHPNIRIFWKNDTTTILIKTLLIMTLHITDFTNKLLYL